MMPQGASLACNLRISFFERNKLADHTDLLSTSSPPRLALQLHLTCPQFNKPTHPESELAGSAPLPAHAQASLFAEMALDCHGERWCCTAIAAMSLRAVIVCNRVMSE